MPASFETLKQEMGACALCPDLPLGPRPIFQLHASARILVVGQAPGRITHAKGRPFDDPSGTRLRDWMGVDRETFYGDPRIGIFPMGLCFPGTGKSGDLPPPALCAQTWRQRVLDHLTGVELTLVLGTYAIAWHLPELQKLSVRDAVRRAADGARCYVLPHPSPRNNRWLKQNPWFEAEVIPRIQADVAEILAKDASPLAEETAQG